MKNPMKRPKQSIDPTNKQYLFSQSRKLISHTFALGDMFLHYYEHDAHQCTKSTAKNISQQLF